MTKILLLSKKTDICKIAQEFTKQCFTEVRCIEGDTGDTLPEIPGEWDYMISFLSPWIIPASMLAQAKYAVNFHPAPPTYPGIGCYNFAIYNKETEYGVTCHHMLPKVDRGKIIEVIRFPMYETDTVFILKNRTMNYLLQLFFDFIKDLMVNPEPPESKEVWLREPYKRKDLQTLCRITSEMGSEEVKLRIKATYFPGAADSPYLELHGEKFFYRSPHQTNTKKDADKG